MFGQQQNLENIVGSDAWKQKQEQQRMERQKQMLHDWVNLFIKSFTDKNMDNRRVAWQSLYEKLENTTVDNFGPFLVELSNEFQSKAQEKVKKVINETVGIKSISVLYE